jgi:hypothetical protein
MKIPLLMLPRRRLDADGKGVQGTTQELTQKPCHEPALVQRDLGCGGDSIDDPVNLLGRHDGSDLEFRQEVHGVFGAR